MSDGVNTGIAPGTRIDGYVVGAEIGRGRMGVVCEARDTEFERSVALRILPETYAGNELFTARFRREAGLAARVSHPNLARVHGAGTWQGRPYIVTALARGRPLDTFLEEEPRPLKWTLHVARETAKGLAAAHAAGLAHRDLRPASIRIDEGDRVRVTGFGVARPRAAEAQPGGGDEIHAARYRPPESFRDEPASPASDVYALGVITHEMLTGRPAFSAESSAALMHAILSGDAPPVQTLMADVPGPVASLVGRMMALDPKARPATCQEVYRTLVNITALMRDESPRRAVAEGAADPGGGGPAQVKRAPRVNLAVAGVLLLALTLGGRPWDRGIIGAVAHSVSDFRYAFARPYPESDRVLVLLAEALEPEGARDLAEWLGDRGAAAIGILVHLPETLDASSEQGGIALPPFPENVVTPCDWPRVGQAAAGCADLPAELGAVRRVPMAFETHDGPAPSFAAAMAGIAEPDRPAPGSDAYVNYGARGTVRVMPMDDLRVRDGANAATLAGKAVVVGTARPVVRTPLRGEGGRLPAAVVQGILVDNVLQGAYYTAPGPGGTAVAIVIAAAVGVALGLCCSRAWLPSFWAAAFLAAMALSGIALRASGTVLPVVWPCALAFAVSAVAAWRWRMEDRRESCSQPGEET